MTHIQGESSYLSNSLQRVSEVGLQGVFVCLFYIIKLSIKIRYYIHLKAMHVISPL